MTINARVRIERPDFTLDVDLKLADRAVTAIFGPSGSGKTTLLRAIAGLEPGCRGDIQVGGQVWQDDRVCRPAHQRPVGFVFQDPSLFPHLDVRENIEYGSMRRKNRVPVSPDRVVELMGLSPLLARQPSQLSGGERQRVALARALASGPELLLLDEPMAALDERRKRDILPYLESIHHEFDIPVLYVSHARHELAHLADDLVLLENGRSTAHGPIADIFARLELPLAHAPDAEAIVDGSVAGYDAGFGLLSVRFPGGMFLVAAPERPPGSPVRLQVLARDVSVTLARQSDTSILNIFPVVVGELVPLGPSQLTARLLAGNVPLLARITRKSANELRLKPGDTVFAQVKSVALLA